ncbi:MAG: hypothetical protein AABZ50_00790 [Pseudomonadota bacterium]
MDTKWKSRAQEELLALYLRLNGFFVTGFIVHSPIHGQNATEVDLLAVRFPYNKEPERQVDPDVVLETSDQVIDLAICEVKSRGQQLQFNQALLASPDRVACVLRWAGIYNEGEIQGLASQVQAALSPSNPPKPIIPSVSGPRQTRVRGLLCSPERDTRRNNQAWFLQGSAILSYISRCLCPPVPRSTCATTYDFGSWGQYEGIVRYIKDRGPNNHGTVGELYAHLQKAL